MKSKMKVRVVRIGYGENGKRVVHYIREEDITHVPYMDGYFAKNVIEVEYPKNHPLPGSLKIGDEVEIDLSKLQF